jgi:uncharacterized coiled-coil protein SlyX
MAEVRHRFSPNTFDLRSITMTTPTHEANEKDSMERAARSDAGWALVNELRKKQDLTEDWQSLIATDKTVFKTFLCGVEWQKARAALPSTNEGREEANWKDLHDNNEACIGQQHARIKELEAQLAEKDEKFTNLSGVCAEFHMKLNASYDKAEALEAQLAARPITKGAEVLRGIREILDLDADIAGAIKMIDQLLEPR